jgi:ABC-type transport system involved in multi-copper enzyme maturation permease subunit
MNRGLLAKAWRETWLLTLVCGLGLVLVEAVEAYALLKFQVQISKMVSHLAFAQRFLQNLLGAEVADQLGPDMFPAIAWAHPAALALVWAHAIGFCTRIPAGEVDRGTIDVLLGLPVSRWQLHVNETLAWLVSGLAVLLAGIGGNTLGTALAHGDCIPPQRLATLGSNLFCLYLAVGGLAWLVSALSDRRGRAVAIALGFVLFSFLLNYLAPFWEVADQLSFLSILHYYVPLNILRDGSWPFRNMLLLLALGAALWTAGGLIFARRDLATL